MRREAIFYCTGTASRGAAGCNLASTCIVNGGRASGGNFARRSTTSGNWHDLARQCFVQRDRRAAVVVTGLAMRTIARATGFALRTQRIIERTGHRRRFRK